MYCHFTKFIFGYYTGPCVRSVYVQVHVHVRVSGLSFLHFQLWDVRRKGCIFTYKGHTESINSIQFSPDGKWVVSASSDSTIKVQYSGIHITKTTLTRVCNLHSSSSVDGIFPE